LPRFARAIASRTNDLKRDPAARFEHLLTSASIRSRCISGQHGSIVAQRR
jgi:hypothetical protein